MKKIIVLLIMILMGCNEYKPGEGTLTAVDRDGRLIGYIINITNRTIKLISITGYIFTINQDGWVIMPDYIITDSDKNLNKENLYVLDSDEFLGTLVQATAYGIFSPTGGITTNPVMYCHPRTAPVTLNTGNGYFVWTQQERVFEYKEVLSTISWGIKIEECPSSITGIPTNIKGPVIIKDGMGNTILA